jgi:hypothetical protein
VLILQKLNGEKELEDTLKTNKRNFKNKKEELKEG